MNGKYCSVAPLLPALLLISFISFTAKSAVETVTVAYSSLGIGDSTSLSFQQFNPALGTLTDVLLELTSHDTLESIVYNPNSNQAGYYAGATATRAVTVATLGLSATTTLQAGPADGTIQPNSIVLAATQTGTAVNEMHVQPSGFSQYIGNGSQTFDVTVQQSSGYYSGNYISPSAQLFFGGDASSFGSIEIDYTYVAVPEPGTAFAGVTALAASAMAAIGSFCISRQSNKNAENETNYQPAPRVGLPGEETPAVAG